MYELYVQVWGDPAFRSFFPDSGEQLGWPAGSGEKPGEPGKENNLAILQVGRSPAHYVVQVDNNENILRFLIAIA